MIKTEDRWGSSKFPLTLASPSGRGNEPGRAESVPPHPALSLREREQTRKEWVDFLSSHRLYEPRSIRCQKNGLLSPTLSSIRRRRAYGGQKGGEGGDFLRARYYKRGAITQPRMFAETSKKPLKRLES